MLSSCGFSSTAPYKFTMAVTPSVLFGGEVAEITSHFEWTDGNNHADIVMFPLVRAEAGTLYVVGEHRPASSLSEEWLEANSSNSGSEVVGSGYIYWVAPVTTSGPMYIYGWNGATGSFDAPPELAIKVKVGAVGTNL